jgi:hypothetical protein
LRAPGKSALHAVENALDVPLKTGLSENRAVGKAMDDLNVRMALIPAKKGDTTTLCTEVYGNESCSVR